VIDSIALARAGRPRPNQAQPSAELGHPCAPSQEVFWALHRLDPSSSVGNEAIALRIRGPLHVDALVQSIEILAAGYDAWHGRVVVDPAESDGCPRIVVSRDEPFAVEQLALEPAAVSSLLVERVRRPFDLEREAPVRVTLGRIEDHDHVLLVVAHHVAFDGYSLFRLLPEDLSRTYSALLRDGRPPARGGEDYAEFAREQRALARLEERASLSFWHRTLAGAELSIDLPAHRSRARLEKTRVRPGKRLHAQVDAAHRHDLEAGARALGGSLSDLLLSAFILVLERHTHQTDLVIGVPNANRRDARFADVFGCLMITAPVRIRVADELTAAQFVARAAGAKREAFQNLDPTLGSLAPCSALYNFMGFSHRDAQLEGLQVEAERPDPGWASADVCLDVTLERTGLTLTLEYDTELLAPELAAELLRRILRVAQLLPELRDVAVGELDVLEESERAALIARGTGPAAATATAERVVDRIAQVARATPDAIAIVCRGQEVAYRELDSGAARVAAQLSRYVRSTGQRVAVMSDDPMLCVMAFLGALKSGACYVPIDPTLPAVRRGWMLEASAPCAVLTDLPDMDLAASSAPVLVLRDLLAAPLTTTLREPPRPALEDAAYVIFTSGSTGRPKGVVATHGNLEHQLAARLAAYAGPPGRMLVTHSFSFDAAVAGLYWTLATGGMLVLLDPSERADPLAIRSLIRRYAVTTLDIVPPLYAELLASDRDRDLETLETVIVGGEECSGALVRAHRGHLPEARLWNEYGPTEATVFATLAEVSRVDAGHPVPIGTPITSSSCYVLDSRGRLVPDGVSGELHLGGLGISPGYLGQEELSAERFLSDPFSSRPQARMFRTGDLARWSRDGQLHFLGRIDRQVKLRGYRVELAEIDIALRSLPGVANAVSVTREGPMGAHVDAYVVLQPGSGASVHSLRQALRDVLPEFMIPRHLEPLAALPVGPSGKIDVGALPEPSGVSGLDSRDSQEPRTPTEQRLADLWRTVLEVDRVGMSDDFFDLGGESLLAVRMLALVRSAFGVEVPLARFARHATIGHLASLVHAEGPLAEEPLVVELRGQGARPPLWLIHAVGGHVVFGRRLLPYLDAEQPVLGIQAQGLDGQREPLRSVESMSDLYAKLILERQPRGPYLLTGSSLGGLIAREIGARLRDAGHDVRLVLLFDTPAPSYPRRAPPRRALHALRVIAREHWQAVRAHWAARQRSRGGGRSSRLAALMRIPPAQLVAEALGCAADCFVPTFQQGTLHVFRALQTPRTFGASYDDPSCGWASLNERVEVVPIDCTHEGMFDPPHVADVGAKLNVLLARLAGSARLLLVLLAAAL
jgi:amino acid adenylation domain-containing protein